MVFPQYTQEPWNSNNQLMERDGHTGDQTLFLSFSFLFIITSLAQQPPLAENGTWDPQAPLWAMRNLQHHEQPFPASFPAAQQCECKPCSHGCNFASTECCSRAEPTPGMLTPTEQGSNSSWPRCRVHVVMNRPQKADLKVTPHLGYSTAVVRLRADETKKGSV